MSTNKYRKCAKCGQTPAQDKSVAFHRFPKPGSTNILRATAWATFYMPDQDWSSVESLTTLYKSSKVLCGRHFQDSCYLDSTKKRLSKHAIPGTREYVIKLMHSLQSKMPSIVQQLAGTSTHQGSSAAKPSILLVNTSQDDPAAKHDVTHHPLAGTSTQQSSNAAEQAIVLVNTSQDDPAAKHDVTHHPLAGTSTQQSSNAAEQAIVLVNTSQDDPAAKHDVTHHPLAGTSTQQSSNAAEQAIVLVNTSQDDPAAKHDVTHHPLAGTSTQQSSNAAEQAIVLETTELKPIKEIKKKQKGILKYLNKSKLSELSEKEQKLYRICTNKIKSLQKLRNRLKMKTKMNRVKKICEDESVQKLFDLKLSNSFIVLLQSQLTNCRRKQKGRRYTLEQKLLALTLYKKSPACYRLLRRLFSLPCQSTLNKLLNKIPIKPGINEHIFSGLQAMAKTQTEEENMCTLVFDEMAIRKHLNYNPKSDSVDGFQDHGNHGRTNQIACNALVFMVCGLRKKWKQPIAFYLSAKTVTADRQAVIIKEILTECFRVGLNVLATVCDLSSVNLKALNKLGATTETPYFNHNGREIVTIADPPHLLKCLRNMFMAHDIQFPTEIHLDGKTVKGIAKWDHVRQFYNHDKNNVNFVYAPALTEKHVNPNTKQKMRVKFAAQVFSHTVSAGIFAKVAAGELPAEALATATLLKKFDQLFDALNANSPDLRRGKKFSTNLTPRSPHLDYFILMKKIIKDMVFMNARSPPPSQSGWVQTLNAVERLWRNVTKLGIKSLSTRRLNQDPLENFFGCVRFNCGSNYNPTISQFIAGFKSAIITNLRQTSRSKNCEDDDGILSNNLKSFLMSPIEQSQVQPVHEDESSHLDYAIEDSEIQSLSSEIQACTYVCGFIIKKLSTKCTQCINLLTTKPGSEPAHLFTEFKEYNEHKNSLNYASNELIMAVEKVASLVKKFLSENLHTENIKKEVRTIIKTNCKEDFTFLLACPMHNVQIFDQILHHVIYISIKRFIILKNRELSEEATAKALERKYKILKHK